METGSDLTVTLRQGLVWWCAPVIAVTPALKVEARGSGVQSQPQLQESPSLKEKCVGSFISPCVGEELVYSDSQFLAWATWVGHENAEEGPGRNDCVRFDMPCAKCPRLAGQGVLELRSGLEGRGLRIG